MNVPKLVFIVPYKNRPEEKLFFSIYMKYILEDYDENDYEIYYSYQIENKPFSRGGTKNIGFIAIKNKYPEDYKTITFVFNDVDTVPCEKNMLNYITNKGIVKHFFGFTYTLGGIFSITGDDFEKCNGFPNLYGWGIEDNEMNDRVLTNNIKIDRSNFHPIKSKRIINFNNNSIRIINNKEPGDFKKRRLIDNLNNINNLEYSIVCNKENRLNNSANEFIINITKYKSLENPFKQEYYFQDVSKSGKLSANIMQKQRLREQWSMKKFIQNTHR
tara:strand:- start:4650 stop:5468 length:819 start_codon:yes stop_codon:yes gene_type:complete